MKEKCMDLAFLEAQKAYSMGEVPVGCIITYKNKVIAKTHNQKEYKKCSLYHAEMIAIRKACKKMKNWRLNDCEMFVTMEPCSMCASAIKQSRISKIYYLVDNPNNSISKQILNTNDLNSRVFVEKMIDKNQYSFLVEKFFQKRRKNKNDK